MEGQTPYQAPSTAFVPGGLQQEDEYDGIELASRVSRLIATILDTLLFLAPLAVMIIPALNKARAAAKGETYVGGSMEAMGAIVGIAFLILMIINIVLLVKNGQTIGKKLLGIKIIRTDGSRAGFWRIALLRSFVIGLLGNIPFIGPIITFVNPLLIFRESQQCLHDQIADTNVIKA